MPTALISVYMKDGIVDFARSLTGLGWKLIASGGTAALLRSAGLPVEEVSRVTHSPEILGGRVKTLHPAIHGGLLARNTDSDKAEMAECVWEMIDMAVVNLYPFEATISRPDATLADAIENIDIGGVALIRAAAKNHDRVTLVCDPHDYAEILGLIESGGVPAETRRRLAIQGFSLTAQYDLAISGYLGGAGVETVPLFPVQTLRYGENPHQTARLFSYKSGGSPLGGTILHGKELSYNNLLDLDAAWRAVVSFEPATVVIVKHLSPCGMASSGILSEAYRMALASDPVSAFGSVVACNRVVDLKTAELMKELFIECIVAPGFKSEAFAILSEKKNLRLIEMPVLSIEPDYEYRSISGGLLRQAIDFGDPPQTEWKVVSERRPTDDEWRALKFAWTACRHVKSNAIVFARGEDDAEATVGIGGGQPNRVDCVRIAAERAGERARGAVMASDAFFPFPDSVELAAKAGVTAVIHPGGSMRDADSLAAANAAGMAMVVTGVRHFRH